MNMAGANGGRKDSDGVGNGRRRSLLDLAPLELDCMTTLWPIGEGTVREIRDLLAPRTAARLHHDHDHHGPAGAQGNCRAAEIRSRVHLPAELVSMEDARTHALTQVVDEFSSRARAKSPGNIFDSTVTAGWNRTSRVPCAIAAAAGAGAGVGIQCRTRQFVRPRPISAATSRQFLPPVNP